jgi:molybdopterin/thiamine biosynthesis adenylyltransferase
LLTKEEKERYNRQIISPSIGEEGQEKIGKVRVLQIGAGGLGSPFALYIVASGIRELTIIDNDVVSLSNLQRQILYDENQIGFAKVDAAKSILEAHNSKIKVNVFKDHINDSSIIKYIKEKNYDFIVDCSDNFQTKFLVNRTAIEYNIKCIIAGIKDFFGQIMTIDPGKSACYQCIFNEPPQSQSSLKPLPVIGVTPGVLGTLEALEVIKTTLGLPNLQNKLLMVNLLNLMFDVIELVKNENCICSKLK